MFTILLLLYFQRQIRINTLNGWKVHTGVRWVVSYYVSKVVDVSTYVCPWSRTTNQLVDGVREGVGFPNQNPSNSYSNTRQVDMTTIVSTTIEKPVGHLVGFVQISLYNNGSSISFYRNDKVCKIHKNKNRNFTNNAQIYHGRVNTQNICIFVPI